MKTHAFVFMGNCTDAFSFFVYNGKRELYTMLLGCITNLVPVAVGNMIGGKSVGTLYRVAYI